MLCTGDIVVMDNLRPHHIQAVGELLHHVGAGVRLNTLDADIRSAYTCASAEDCTDWLRCAVYCLF